MHSADYAVVRCPSICLSHVGIVSKRLNISRNFVTSGSHIGDLILFFIPNFTAIVRRGPPNRNVECRKVFKNLDFRPFFCFISEMIHDRAIVTMERQ